MRRFMPTAQREILEAVEQGSPYDEHTKDVADRWLAANRDRLRAIELKLNADSRRPK